jgi:hypothetical protein
MAYCSLGSRDCAAPDEPRTGGRKAPPCGPGAASRFSQRSSAWLPAGAAMSSPAGDTSRRVNSSVSVRCVGSGSAVQGGGLDGLMGIFASPSSS